MIEFCRKKNRQIFLIAELQGDKIEVTWLRGDEDPALVELSENCGILQDGSALEEWLDGGHKQNFAKRAVSVRILSLNLVSVFQPLWFHGTLAMDNYRQQLDKKT